MSRWPRVPALSALVLGTCLMGPAAAQPAGGPPIDPRAMSGIPRVDAQTEPGTITVRCLLGSFRDPAAGVTVKLELRSADGGKLETRSVVAGDDGRASFGELGVYFGGTAVASVDFSGELVKSQPITLAPTEGVRVLLVKGASSAGAGTGEPAAPAGPSDVPMPGTAFANPNAPKGTVLVGTLDLRSGAPVVGAKVRLKISRPGAADETREADSDARGTARFSGLEALPPEAILVAEADLSAGTQRSQPFALAGQETGMAVVLAVVGQRASARRPLQPPRGFPTIPSGTVRVTVVGADDGPLGEVPLAVVKQDVSGLSRRFEGQTGDDGVARVADIDVAEDGLYLVEAEYGGAPWRSPFFRLDDRMGVAVEMRLFKVTGDLTRVRSAVQFGVEPLENDLARVAQLLQVHVDGDEAFWPERPLKISPGEGAAEIAVLERADMLLDHKNKAPFATLSSPIPPGEVVDLSIGYLLEHDGGVDIRWASPFPVVDARTVVTTGLTLTRGAKGPPKRPQHEQAEARADIDVYELGAMPLGQAFDLRVEGLVRRSRLYQYLGLALGLVVAFACGIAFALRPREGLRQRLTRRRDRLLRKLDAAAPDQRDALIAELDAIYFQLDALAGGGRHVDPGAAWTRS